MTDTPTKYRVIDFISKLIPINDSFLHSIG